MSLLRSLLFTLPAIVLSTLVLGVVDAITWWSDRSGKWQDRLSQLWCRSVLAASSIRVSAEGFCKLDPHGQYVFVANHSSYLDTPALLTQLPGKTRFFAYRGLFNFPFFGAHLKRAGHLPVDSSSARASLKSMTEGAHLVAERGISVILFPEGSRSSHGLREFREGAAYIAIKASVPIVPIGIVGMRELMPVGSIHIRSGNVRVRIGDPIATAGLGSADRSALTHRVRAEVASLLADGSSPDHCGDAPFS